MFILVGLFHATIMVIVIHIIVKISRVDFPFPGTQFSFIVIDILATISMAMQK